MIKIESATIPNSVSTRLLTIDGKKCHAKSPLSHQEMAKHATTNTFMFSKMLPTINKTNQKRLLQICSEIMFFHLDVIFHTRMFLTSQNDICVRQIKQTTQEQIRNLSYRQTKHFIPGETPHFLSSLSMIYHKNPKAKIASVWVRKQTPQ